MKRESSLWALVVVTLVVAVSSLLVSAAVVLLRPIQQDNRTLDQARNIIRLVGDSGLTQNESDDLLLERFRALDARVVDFESSQLLPGQETVESVLSSTMTDHWGNTAIPDAEDTAQIGSRANRVVVYLVWGKNGLERIIFPVYGMGMWSTLRGYMALGPDLNTIVDVSIYEQSETPGVGDQVTRPEWLAKWRGRKIYDEEGVPQFAVAPGKVEPGSASELHSVDAITGATVTTDAVTELIRFWFGPWGFQATLENLREHPPHPPSNTGDDS